MYFTSMVRQVLIVLLKWAKTVLACADKVCSD